MTPDEDITAEEKMARLIRARVDKAPPLSRRQQEVIRAMLAPPRPAAVRPGERRS